MKKSIGLLIAMATLLGCATTSAGHAAYERLTPPEKEDLRNCQVSLQQHQCGANSRTAGDDAFADVMLGPGAAKATCMNGLIAAYAESPDKKRWLVKNGCPRDMVE